MTQNTHETPSDEELFGDCLPSATDAEVKGISQLVKESVALSEQIKVLQEKAKALTEQKFKLDTDAIPNAMQQAGLLEMTTDDGGAVKVENKIYGSISAKNKEAALTWLRDNNHGSLIKNEFRVPFGKGEDAKAASLEQFLKSEEVDYARQDGVHAQTLQAFVREQIQQSKPLPLELFGVHIQPTAIIKTNK